MDFLNLMRLQMKNTSNTIPSHHLRGTWSSPDLEFSVMPNPKENTKKIKEKQVNFVSNTFTSPTKIFPAINNFCYLNIYDDAVEVIVLHHEHKLSLLFKLARPATHLPRFFSLAVALLNSSPWIEMWVSSQVLLHLCFCDRWSIGSVVLPLDHTQIRWGSAIIYEKKLSFMRILQKFLQEMV